MTRKNFTRDLFQRSRKIVSLKTKSPKTRTLRLESLEERQLLSATPEGLLASSGDWGVVSENAPEPSVLGLDELSSAVGDYDEGDLAVVESLGLTAESEGVVWNDQGRLVELTCSQTTSTATSVDLTGCDALRTFSCGGASGVARLPLRVLNASGCANLETLNCHFCELTSLDVSDCPNLQTLHCLYNPLTEFVVDGCEQLQEVWCYGNNLTELNIANCLGVQVLWCQMNDLRALDFSNLPNLRVLECHDNSRLTSLNLSNCADLNVLYCGNTGLRELDLSSCPNLATLNYGWELERIGLCREVNIELSLYHKSQWNAIRALDGMGDELTVTSGQYEESIAIPIGAPDSVTIEYLMNDEIVGTTTINGSPQPQTLAAPTLALTSVTENSLTVEIGEVENATSYVLEYGTDQNYENSESLNVLASGELLLEGLSPETTYFLRVKATDGETESDWHQLTAETASESSPYDPGDLAVVESLGLTAESEGVVWNDEGRLVELHCSQTIATSVDLTGCDALTTFACGDNDSLLTLNASGCANLQELDCSRSGLMSIDLSGCVNLETLNCSFAEAQLLRLSDCANLKFLNLHCYGRQSLDISGLPNLQSLDCAESYGLMELRVSNCANLQYLDFSVTSELTELVISNCASLKEIECVETALTDLDLSDCASLECLVCRDSSVARINLANCASLRNLICNDCDIAELDLSDCVNLSELDCNGNRIAELDLSSCRSLTQLYCHRNELTRIDCSSLDYLQYFGFDSNVAEVELSENTAVDSIQSTIPVFDDWDSIEIVDGSGSEVETTSAYNWYDFSIEPASCPITISYLKNDEIVGTTTINGSSQPETIDSPTFELVWADVDAIELEIGEVAEATGYVLQYGTDPTFATCETLELTRPGSVLVDELSVANTYYLRVKAFGEGGMESDWIELTAMTYYWDDQALLESLGLTPESEGVVWNEDGRLSELILVDPMLTTLTVGSSDLWRLDASGCPNLQTLDCGGNIFLSDLNLSGCENLQTLICDGSQLSELDLSGFQYLRSVNCETNALLSTLCVSNCPNLETLNCSLCQLTELDVSNCPNLQTLSCWDNELSELDVSSCPNLRTLSCEINNISELDVSRCPNLQYLACNNNDLTALDVASCRNLQTLYCGRTNLTALDVSNCPNLETLSCERVNFSELDLANCPNLGTLTYGSELEIIKLCREIDVELNVERFSNSQWNGIRALDGMGNELTVTAGQYGSAISLPAETPDSITVEYLMNDEIVGTTTINGSSQTETLAAPTLALTSATANSLTVEIGEVDGATGYVLEYGTDQNYENCESLNVLASGELLLEGLSPETTYYLRVKATDGETESDWTELTATTDLATLAVPTLSFADVEARSITIVVGEVDCATSYVVEYREEEEPYYDSGWIQIIVDNPGEVVLDPTGEFNWWFESSLVSVRVKAISSTVESPWSEIATATTPAWDLLPLPEYDYVATTTEITFAFEPLEGAQGIYIGWTSDPEKAENNEADFSDYLTGSGSWTLSNLRPGTVYYFQFGGDPDGPFYNTIADFVPISTLPQTLDAPTFAVLATSDNSATLSIGPVANAASYVVEYATSANYENSATVTFAAPGEVQIANLNPNTQYYFRVKATAEGFDDSDWTETTATTLAVKLAAPTVAVAATETEISVSVSAVPSAERYVLEYATNPEFTNASTRTTSAAGTVVLSDLPEATQFYVRVKATAANYADSDWTLASAATLDPLLVTNVEDSYATTGSLRRAIAKAKDGDVVRFAPELAGQTILLVNGELLVDKAITIDASAVWNDADFVPGVTIDADSKSRVFNLDADATLVALNITGGKAERGGGVLVAENRSAELTRCVVAENVVWSEQNSTTVRGAGICALGDLILEETVVRDNSASTDESVSNAYVFGGGIYVGADLAMISSVVAKNKTEAKIQNLAYSFGAGVYVATGGSAVVVGSSIRLNSTEFYTSNDFAASFSRSFGGGAFVAENASLVVNSSDVSNNYAKHQGGGVYSLGVVLVSNESVVQTNKSNSFGGGLCSEGELTIDGNSLVVGNYSGSGGGVYSIGKLTASNVEIRDNVAETSARAEGGGLYLGGPSTILETRIFDNSAKAVNPSVSVTALGGGVCVDASRNAAANVSLTNCAIFGNDVEAISGREANARGGGLYSNAALASVVATNVEVSGNLVDATSYGTIRNQDSAYAQGGGVCGDFGLTLVNASIVANSAEATALSSNAFDDGDGAYFYGRGTRDLFALDNCVVALNGDEGDDIARASETVVRGRASLSSFAEWSNASEPGVENYPYAPNDPIFADFEGGDYRPALDGQLVDRGDDELLPSGVLVDLDGNARVQNVVDLGAYETPSEGRLAPPSLSLARAGSSVLLEIGASEDASRYAIEYGTDPTFAASSSITRDSAGSFALAQIPADVTLYVRVRAEALGRVSSIWTRDYVGTYGESAAWESTTDVLPDAYEPNDSLAFAADLGALSDATTLQINLHSASDVDLFKFSTVANGGAGNFVRVEYAKATDGIDLALELYDATGSRIATSKGPTGVEEISLENLPAGEYRVRLANVRSTAKPGDCALTIAPPAPLREGELDRPVFDAAPSDSSVVVDIAEVPGASQYVAQYGTSPDFTGASERVFDSPGAKTLSGLAPSTLYYVRVKALAGTPSDFAPLFDESDAPLPNDEIAAESEWTAISVKTDAPRDASEPNDALDEAFDLGTVYGETTRALNLHSDSDVDWFKFSLAATCGSDREIRLTFSETIGADLDMELFDSQGERVALANGTSDVETISLAKFRPGDYWLRVYNASPRPGVVAYELAILAPEENALDAPIATIVETNRNSFDVVLTEVAGAETYVLEFGTDPDYENASTKTFATSGLKTLDNLPEGVRIYCRVKAVANARESAWFEFDGTTTIPRDYCEPNDSIDASRSLGTLSESAEFLGFTFHSATDEDWYSFAIVANGSEENVVRALYEYDADRFALGLLLYNSEGRLVAGSERSGDLDELSLANLPAGAYRLRVYNRSASRATGRYSLRFAPPASLPEGTLDRPILAATVSDKSIALAATDVPNASQFLVEYGTVPTFVNSLTLVGNGAFAIDDLTPETTYWLRVKAIADGFADSAWSALVLATSGERDKFEPNDSIETATDLGTLSEESRCDLTLHDGTDVDWFKFVLSDPDGEGRLVKLTYPQSATVDVDLELYDANGALLAASRETTGVETISIDAFPAGTYFVRAFNYLASGDSTPYSLEFSAPVPVAKTLAAPELAGSTTKTAIIVKIYPVQWAERYVVEYGTDPTFATCKTKTYTSVAQPKTFSGLETGTKYYVRVRAVAEGLDDSPSATMTLIPGGLTLTAPNLSASATKTAVVVNIKPVDGADQYVLEYGLNPDFSDAVVKTYKTSGPRTFTKAPFGTPYYFRVKAVGEGVNDSKWSEISFAAGQLASTTLKSTGVNYGRVEFSVTSVPNAVGCAIEYSKNSDFSDSTLVSFSTFGAKTIAGLDENSTYYFRAKALGDGTNRCDSAWTSTLVKSTVSYQGELAAPSVSFTMVKTSIVFKFAAVPNATKYVLDLGLDPNFATYSTKVYATAGSKTVTGLQSGATYYFRLRSTAPGYDDSDFVRFTAATTPSASSAVLDAESPYDDAFLDEFEELEEFWDLLAESRVK